MKNGRIWKKAKRVLAFALALAISVSGWQNYGLTVQADETTEKTFTVILSSDSLEYTGTDLSDSITVKEVTVGGTTVDAEDAEGNANYSIEWNPASIIDVGSYTCTVTGKDDTIYDGYTGEAEFTVTAKPLTADTVTVTGWSDSLTYPATLPTVTLTDGSNTLTEGTDYEVAWSGPNGSITDTSVTLTVIGDYKATITGKGNYQSPITKTFKYSKRELSAAAGASIVLSSSEDTYSSTRTAFPTVKIKANGIETENGFTATWTKQGETSEYDPTNGIAVGTYTVTVTASDDSAYFTNPSNTGNQLTATYTVKQANINSVTLSSSGLNVSGSGSSYALTYQKGNSATVKTDDITVTVSADNGNNLTKETDYKYTWSDTELTPGNTYTLTISAGTSGNYKVDSSVEKITFTYNKGSLQAELSNTSGSYQAGATLPTVTVKDAVNSEKLTKGTDYSVQWTDKNGTEVSGDIVDDFGTYTATVTGLGNYDDSKNTVTLSYTYEALGADGNLTLSFDDANVSNNVIYFKGSGQAFPSYKVVDATNSVDPVAADDQYSAKWTDSVGNTVNKISSTGEYKLTVTMKEDGNYTGTLTLTLTVEYGDGSNLNVSYDPSASLTTNIYPDKLTIKPSDSENYEISKTDSEFGASIEYTSSESNGITVYLKNKGTGVISKKTISTGFTIYTTTPSITKVEISDEDAWKPSKTVTVTGTDADYGYYYFVSDDGTDPMNGTSVITAKEDLTGQGLSNTNGTFTISDEKDATGKTLYIYAVDKAGHVTTTSTTIKKIDTKKPSISLTTVSVKQDKNDTSVYWKPTTEDTAMTVGLKVTDESISSGFTSDTDAFTMTTSDGEIADGQANQVPDATSGAVTFKIYKPGTYTFHAKDDAGNDSSNDITITVKQDTGVPEVTIEKESDDFKNSPENNHEIYYDKAKDVYWTGTGVMSIPLTITDEKGKDSNGNEITTEEKSTYVLQYSIDDEKLTSPKEITVTNNIATLDLTDSVLKSEAQTVYFRVTDNAGNVGTIQSIQVAKDTETLTIGDVTFPQNTVDPDNNWLNATELGLGYLTSADEPTRIVKLQATVPDGLTGVRDIVIVGKDSARNAEVTITKTAEQLTSGKDDVTYMDNGDGTKTYVFSITIPQDAEYQWSVTATNNVQNSGAKSGINAYVDVTVPEEVVYVQFTTDTDGQNSTDDGDKTAGSWISKFWDATQKTWNKIWGKQTVNFSIYIQDQTAGMQDTITVTYGADPANGVTFICKKEAGLTAFTANGSFGEKGDTVTDNAEGYTLYTGSFTIQASTDVSIENFVISDITDIAGNTRNQIKLTPTESNFIYLDAVTPVLTEVSVDGSSVAQSGDTYFFNGAKQLKLSIDERFFDEIKEYRPVVTLYHKTSTETTWTSAEVENLTWKNESANIWTTYVVLANVEGQETEYYLTVSYADPSANNLTVADGIQGELDNGTYKSKTFIIDAVAPVLTSYSVNAANTWTDANGNAQQYTLGAHGATAYDNKDGGDLVVTFTLDENGTYISDDRVEKVVEVYERGENGGADKLIASTASGAEQTLEVKRSGDTGANTTNRTFTYTFSFDGKTSADPENEYYVVISYTDAAGNKMISDSDSLEVTDGTYTSADYVIDHVAPVFGITFNDAFQVLDNSTGETQSGTKPQENMVSYYGSAQGQVTVTITLTEKYVYWKGDALESEIADFSFLVNDTDKQTDITWEQNGTTYTGTYVIKEEGNYTITASYSDPSDNLMVGGTTEGGSVEDGTYTSPQLVLDTTKPVVVQTYSADAVNTYGERKYYNADTTLTITVTDHNIRYKELKDSLSKMTATDISGTAVETSAKTLIDGIAQNTIMVSDKSEADQVWTVQLLLDTEANYTIPIAYTDLAGNTAELNVTEQPTVDKTVPTELQMSYSVNDPVNYGLFGWLFSQVSMTITASTTDQTAGLQYIRFTVTDENNKVTVKTQEFAPSADGTYSVEIPLETADFKGTVKAEALDYSTNQTELTRNHAVESGDRHSSNGKAVIVTNTSPSRTVNGVDFYNTDVNLKLQITDLYSGLRSYEYVLGNTENYSRNFAEEAGTDLTKDSRPDVTYSVEHDLVLTAADNNQNEVQVTANFVDNTRRVGAVEQLYNIDTTVPEITVTYDLNTPANEKYYNKTRTATVTIRERNFDENDVEFIITNTDGVMPSISGWSTTGSGDETYHTCTVTFAADGDYTFTLKFQDMAGNWADYSRVDEFTIDQTIPTMTVTWDNNDSKNDYYYDAGRTATIDILEHNFDASLVNVTMTAGGDATSTPVLSGWTRSGDHNIAHVTFGSDGDYTINISGMDQADNPLADFQEQRFVVDMTAPELEIFDIENMSANNGVVRPGIRYSDTNYDESVTSVVMNGYNNGVVELDGSSTVTETGVELKMNDFAHTQDMDDLYTMNATVYDKAGNSSKASVIFSVNRFGSVYTYSDETAELVGEDGKYYTNQEQEIVVTETNVDTLEFKEITCNLNGTLTTMTEGEDYTVQESGSDTSWKQYTYTMPAENFAEEGTYRLTIYSEDRATNTSDNNTKGKEIEFVVDKTSPSVLVSGVENDGQYRENSRDVTLDVEDNVLLSQVIVDIDGTETTYDMEQISEANGKLVLTAGSANHWQTMVVSAVDAAGNIKSTESMRFLITSNILIQFVNNRPLFFGSLAGLIVIAAGTWWFLFAAKRRKDKDDNQSAAA